MVLPSAEAYSLISCANDTYVDRLRLLIVSLCIPTYRALLGNVYYFSDSHSVHTVVNLHSLFIFRRYAAELFKVCHHQMGFVCIAVRSHATSCYKVRHH